MTALVLDASVAAKLLFEEEQTADAEAVVGAAGVQLLAPDLLVAEVASVIWKRARRGEITPEQAGELLDQFLAMPVSLSPTSELASAALELAVSLDRSVYDSLYLALAITADAIMLTADVRLVNALGGTALADRVRRLSAG